MAIERVCKVAVAIHRDKKEEFLSRLQRLGILHIVQITEGDAEITRREGDGAVNQLLKTIEALGTFESGKGVSRKVVINRTDYERIAEEYELDARVKEIERALNNQNELQGRLRALEEEIKRLKPWENLRYSPAALSSFASVKALLGRFPGQTEFNEARQALEKLPVAVEKVSEEAGAGVYVLLLVVREAVDEVLNIINGQHWESVELKDGLRSPNEVIRELRVEQERIKGEIVQIEREIAGYIEELPRLKVKADALLNKQRLQEVEQTSLVTESVLLIYGWVKERDFNKLERLVEEMKTAAVTKVTPGPGEMPPVALRNRRLWRPFELILELYQLPLPNELDPTWLIAPFFGMFFALCLTDAGYGIVVALVAFFLMRRMGMDNKLLGVILIGALLTIPAGALMGGWFGDMPDRLGVEGLAQMKNRLLWFDPMKDPMKFFILSLGLGYLQLIAGITFEIADCIRLKNYGDAFLGQLPWFLFLNSIVVRLILLRSLPLWVNAGLLVVTLLSCAAIIVFTRREKETLFAQWLWFFLLGGVLIYFAARFGALPPALVWTKWAVFTIFLVMLGNAALLVLRSKPIRLIPLFFGIITLLGLVLYFLKIIPAIVPGGTGLIFYNLAPTGKRLWKKFAWGGYALYGATSYIGVLLSYIRLMALGMCTGGVAMAINVIAWMVGKVPFVGVLLALIVLVIGHTYNIAVNVLGAFVHSLRLQYVEFFPRFYTGGGEPFVPLREVNQFVVLKS